MPSHPLRLTDPAGVRWYVADEHHEPLARTRPRRVPAGSDPAVTHRLFARRSALDGAWDVYLHVFFCGEDPTDLAPATLLAQARAASGPAPRRGESVSAYLERLRALYPSSFRPPAWPRPLPEIPRRGWSVLERGAERCAEGRAFLAAPAARRGAGWVSARTP